MVRSALVDFSLLPNVSHHFLRLCSLGFIQESRLAIQCTHLSSLPKLGTKSNQMIVKLQFCVDVDSLRYTSALSVALAVVFVAITAGMAFAKVMEGTVSMPRLMPRTDKNSSFWKPFTTFPVLVTAYICHFSSKPANSS